MKQARKRVSIGARRVIAGIWLVVGATFATQFARLFLESLISPIGGSPLSEAFMMVIWISTMIGAFGLWKGRKWCRNLFFLLLPVVCILVLGWFFFYLFHGSPLLAAACGVLLALIVATWLACLRLGKRTQGLLAKV